MDGMSEPERYSSSSVKTHDPRCISLTDGEFNDTCDCRTLAKIDEYEIRRILESGNPEAKRPTCGCYMRDEDCPSHPNNHGR